RVVGPGGRRPAPPRDPGDRAPRAAGGSSLAFSAAQAAAAAELRGAGVSSGGFGIVSRVRAVALVVVAEEVGVAQDDQRDQRGKLGDDQSDGREQRPAGEAGAWDGGPDRQHGDAGADARAQRQLSAVGWGAGDDALAGAGDHHPGGAGDRLVQSPITAGWPRSVRSPSNTAAAKPTTPSCTAT